jgi:cysteine desulfurase
MICTSGKTKEGSPMRAFLEETLADEVGEAVFTNAVLGDREPAALAEELPGCILRAVDAATAAGWEGLAAGLIADTEHLEAEAGVDRGPRPVPANPVAPKGGRGRTQRGRLDRAAHGRVRRGCGGSEGGGVRCRHQRWSVDESPQAPPECRGYGGGAATGIRAESQNRHNQAMEPSTHIYLDYQATTPVDPRVLDAMLPFFGDRFGNPASVQHAAGESARLAVEEAREQVASLIGADRREIVLCSGATEASNLALKGLAGASERRHLIVSSIEHPAVLDVARSLRRHGFELTELPVDRDGQISLADLDEAISERTLLVSVGAANNEIGTLAPLGRIADIAHAKGALLHSDAAQAAGKIGINVRRDGIDMMSLSAHKMYGPKGAGALFVRRCLQSQLEPLVDGGGHEGGLRSGTVNVPAVVGFGAAAVLTGSEKDEASRLRHLAGRLHDRLRSGTGEVGLNGPAIDGSRLPGNLNVRFKDVDAEILMANCPELAISAGSACSAATPTPSHVLTAIGLHQEEAEQSIRIGVGRPTTEQEALAAADVLVAAVTRVRRALGEPIGAP